jgi:hypothetical protein
VSRDTVPLVADDKQMRAAWSRRTDEELLHAHFLEELTADGRRVVAELVTAKVGAIDAYVRAFADEQGDIVARLPVRGVEVALEERALPAMWGMLVLATRGIGFLAGGHDDELGPGLAARLDITGELAEAVWSGLRHAMNPVANRTGIALPLPLLARIEPSAIWLPHARYDEVLWGPDFGEVVGGGERLLAVEPTEDAEPIVRDWAVAHDVLLTALEPSPLLR